MASEPSTEKHPPSEEKPSKPKVCKDCKAVESELDLAPRKPPRPAPYPGPRCATHNREAKKGRKETAHASYVARTYSITAEQYEAMLEAQGGTCAICQRATGKTRKLSVDHDHKCCNGSTSCGNCVRGLLCRPCNDLLGHGRDDIQFFGRAIAYLADPPARKVCLVKECSAVYCPTGDGCRREADFIEQFANDDIIGTTP